jgi:hypothetical protein
MKQKENGQENQREFIRGLPVCSVIADPEKEESRE